MNKTAAEPAGGCMGLPRGMGYKSCWMAVEGAAQKAVADAFLQGRKMTYPYSKGLEKVEKAAAKENRLMVSAAYQGRVYVVGAPVSRFFYETEEFLAKCQAFARVYVYMTHRVSETHGFALVERGRLVRFFRCDENGVESSGAPLPEELALGCRLPQNLEELQRGDGGCTPVDEEMLVALAARQVGVNLAQYPYKAVKVGRRFAYAAELAKDPYPREDQPPADQTRLLPLAQRFLAAGTYRQKLELVQAERAALTHPLIDLFSGEIETGVSYGRLSERTEELLSILDDLADIEDRTMTQQDFLQALREGVSTFEDRIFKNFPFAGLACPRLTFCNCSFFHVPFGENEIGRLELRGCHFNDAIFTGRQQNTSWTLRDVYFWKCSVHDFALTESCPPAELTDCRFDTCRFDNVAVDTALLMREGWLSYCSGTSVRIRELQAPPDGQAFSLRETRLTDCSVNGQSAAQQA